MLNALVQKMMLGREMKPLRRNEEQTMVGETGLKKSRQGKRIQWAIVRKHSNHTAF